MNQITPYPLWVGHAGDARAFGELFDLGIRAIVQLAIEEPPVQPPREFIFCRFPLLDGDGNDADVLCLAIKSVASLIEREVPTLVCCGAGMSRSPAIIAAALSLVKQISLEECLTRVAEFHPTDLSPGLWAQVTNSLVRKQSEGAAGGEG